MADEGAGRPPGLRHLDPAALPSEGGGGAPADDKHGAGQAASAGTQPALEPTGAGTAADMPKPSSYLQHSKAKGAVVPVGVANYMELDSYLEARAHTRLCNLQLKAASASAEELEQSPAHLPAADAFRLSPVLKARLESWEPDASVGSVDVLELQIGVPQDLVDAVVQAVYARQLSVSPRTAESLLLLADYLQLDWLTQAVGHYLECHVLSCSPVAVCQLSQQYASLGLFRAASDRVLERLQPEELAALAQLTPEPAERLSIFTTVSRRGTPVQCLHLMCLLLGVAEGQQPTWAELHAVTSRHPELAMALLQTAWSSDGPVAGCEALWCMQYRLHHEAVLAEQAPTGVLVWPLPLRQLRDVNSQRFPKPLRTSDGRSFQLQARRLQHGARRAMGLWVLPLGGCSWRPRERIMFSAVQRPGGWTRQHVVELAQGRADHARAQECGMGHATLIDDWTQTDAHTICNGAYLPVSIAILAPAP